MAFKPLEGRDPEKEVQSVLPHYDRGKKNIRGFLQPGVEEIRELIQVIQAVADCLFLSTATGKALDMIGERWGVVRREGESDEAYRKRIRFEIKICLSSGTTDDIRSLVCEYFGWPGSSIRINRNWSSITGKRDAFYEIQVPTGWLVQPEQPKWFKFSDDPTVSTYESEHGFNKGKFKYPSWIPAVWKFPYNLDAFLDRITASGVEWLISLYGGFRFSLNPLESTYDSDRGFDRGKLVGAVG